MARSAWDLEVDRQADWRLSAACRGYDPEWWSLSGVRGEEYKAAHKICLDCPVMDQCYAMAVRTGSWGLIYGGVDFDKPRASDIPQIARCERCHATYQRRVSWSRYCSLNCRQRSWERDQRRHR